MNEEIEEKVRKFMKALTNYIQATVDNELKEEQDSIGTYYEEKELRERLFEMLGIEEK